MSTSNAARSLDGSIGQNIEPNETYESSLHQLSDLSNSEADARR